MPHVSIGRRRASIPSIPYTTLFRSDLIVVAVGDVEPPGRVHRDALREIQLGGHGGSSVTARRRLRADGAVAGDAPSDRKSTRLNSSHANNSYDVFGLKKKTIERVSI